MSAQLFSKVAREQMLIYISYLVLMRPPTRELCLDALEDLYKNGKCQIMQYGYFYIVVMILTGVSPKQSKKLVP